MYALRAGRHAPRNGAPREHRPPARRGNDPSGARRPTPGALERSRTVFTAGACVAYSTCVVMSKVWIGILRCFPQSPGPLVFDHLALAAGDLAPDGSRSHMGRPAEARLTSRSRADRGPTARQRCGCAGRPRRRLCLAQCLVQRGAGTIPPSLRSRRAPGLRRPGDGNLAAGHRRGAPRPGSPPVRYQPRFAPVAHRLPGATAAPPPSPTTPSPDDHPSPC